MKGMKQVCGLIDDRITNLPVDVIHRILVLVDTKDAAKMATLSTKWRRHWRSIPQLKFEFLDYLHVEKGPSELNEMATELISDIHKVLLVHDGPITKFQLFIDRLKSCDGIDQIVDYLSNRGLQELDLNFTDSLMYKLHSSLFNSLHLNSLSLCSCEFRQPSWAVGFSKLTCLVLGQVTLPSDFFQNFLLKCPVLRYLSLMSCEGPSNHEIVAPCLKKFFFYGVFEKLYFKCTPLLEVVDILIEDRKVDKPADMVALFASLPALKRFYVDLEVLEYLAAGDANLPLRLPAPLRWLKILHIYHPELGSLKKARAFVCLILSSPNLHELRIERGTNKPNRSRNTDAGPSIGTLLEAEDRNGSGCCLQHLRLFELQGSLAVQVELDLLRFVLANAPLLRKICIIPAPTLRSSKASKFMKEVRRYKRISEVDFRYGVECYQD